MRTLKKASESSRSARPAPSKNPVHEILSIVLLASAVFAAAALLTHHAADPSLFSTTTAPAKNACGWVGAYLSALLLQSVGIGAFLVPAALAFLAASLFQGEGAPRFLGTLAGMGVALAALTVFVALQWQYWPYRGELLLTGGALGGWMVDELRGPLNPLGASILSFCVFLAAIALSTPVSVMRGLGWLARTMVRAGVKTARAIGMALFYLVSIALMKFAHALGDGIQRVVEGAVRRARERARAFAESRERAALERSAGGLLTSAPHIAPRGVEGRQMHLEEAFDADEADDDGDGEIPGVQADDEAEAALASAVDGFGDAVASGAVSDRPRGKGAQPTILPAGQKASAQAAEAAERAALKLAKAKTRPGQWKLPTIEFLKKVPRVESKVDRERLIQNSHILKQKLADFGIDGEVTAVRPGPVITLYEFRPGPGVKVSRIASLSDDLSMALSAESVRILAPLPGKSVVGIEIPSDERETVYLREFLADPDFYGDKLSIPVAMGKDIGGKPTMSDLARMPHVLCAGQTGSGKSVFMNGLICSLLYRFTPDELRMILVDPKFIEFRSYEDIPHLLLPVVDDPGEASIALKWAVREMERRYRLLAMMGARNLAAFNRKVEEMGAETVRDLLMSEESQNDRMTKLPGGDWHQAFEMGENGAPNIGKLPFIVVIIDELADLMMVAKKDVEVSIARIAQKARAAGIHLVIATQRPSTDVITGLIKANLPSRVSFQLASFVDSKTILDRSGAERLLGQGDMLFIPPGVSNTMRLHGAFVSDDEINKITGFLRSQGEPSYRTEILVDEDEEAELEDETAGDPLFDEAIELVKRSGHASASFLQRHLKVGYNRAARMIEDMETRGLVGPADGSRPREVLVR
ncbi:MAG: DNA translocase FtsK 4TM domain-containing protein [Bdellovibrionales bacterium]|nr:DNA translocase FtsK 4TM domain-containing protein [Bdellovibrionales bacterium]